jgi:hypothetical protein
MERRRVRAGTPAHRRHGGVGFQFLRPEPYAELLRVATIPTCGCERHIRTPSAKSGGTRSQCDTRQAS